MLHLVTVHTICKQQADITTASSAGNVFQHHCVNKDWFEKWKI